MDSEELKQGPYQPVIQQHQQNKEEEEEQQQQQQQQQKEEEGEEGQEEEEQQQQQEEEESFQDRYRCKVCSIYLDGINQYDKHLKDHQKQDKARKQKNIRKRNKKNRSYDGVFWGWGYGRKTTARKVSKSNNENENQENGNENGQGNIYCNIVAKVKKIRKVGGNKGKKMQLEWMKKNQDILQGHEVGEHKLRERKKINYSKYIQKNQEQLQQSTKKNVQKQNKTTKLKQKGTKPNQPSLPNNNNNNNNNNNTIIDIESPQIQNQAKIQTQNKSPYRLQTKINVYQHQNLNQNVHYNYNVHNQLQYQERSVSNLCNQKQRQKQIQKQKQKQKQEGTEKSMKIIIQQQYKWISRLSCQLEEVKGENAELKRKMEMIVLRNNNLEEQAKRYLNSGFNNVQTYKQPSTQKPPNYIPQKPQKQPQKPPNNSAHIPLKNTATNPKKSSQKANERPIQKNLQHFFKKSQVQKTQSKQNISSNMSQKEQKINKIANGKQNVKVEEDEDVCERQERQERQGNCQGKCIGELSVYVGEIMRDN